MDEKVVLWFPYLILPSYFRFDISFSYQFSSASFITFYFSPFLSRARGCNLNRLLWRDGEGGFLLWAQLPISCIFLDWYFRVL